MAGGVRVGLGRTVGIRSRNELGERDIGVTDAESVLSFTSHFFFGISALSHWHVS